MPNRARIGTVIALGTVIITALIATSAAAQTELATQTSLTAETREIGGHTVATFTATVLGANGRPASGAVVLRERGRDLAGAALNAEGLAEIRLTSLAIGDHAVQAVYQGNSSASASQSETVTVHPQATATPDYTIAIAPASFTLKAGQAGTLKTTITPVNNFTGFISLSCSGTSKTSTNTSLPVGVSCAFSPANVQVTGPTSANPEATVSATMTLQTTGAGGPNADNRAPAGPDHADSPLFLAMLLPGIVGLGFIGRKRKLFKGAAVLVALGAVTLLGTTACSARYNYLHHGPTFTGTPTGTYTLNVTAQTSNGVTASSHSMPLALTVN